MYKVGSNPAVAAIANASEVTKVATMTVAEIFAFLKHKPGTIDDVDMPKVWKCEGCWSCKVNRDMGAHHGKPTPQSLVVTIGQTQKFRIQFNAGDDSEPILGASVASKSSLHSTCCASSSGEASAPTNTSEEKKEAKHARLSN
ncbi:hypothetical protein Bca4012_027199 [Brassica carinata]|uniref:Uncharacterized protein n=1 Tax=Brassica carinata TaxID=52824 RepID=A0A8X7VJZ8_BRACI|nr:hypothetical protein Bca52824_024193 [Brassica carinata]